MMRNNAGPLAILGTDWILETMKYNDICDFVRFGATCRYFHNFVFDSDTRNYVGLIKEILSTHKNREIPYFILYVLRLRSSETIRINKLPLFFLHKLQSKTYKVTTQIIKLIINQNDFYTLSFLHNDFCYSGALYAAQASNKTMFNVFIQRIIDMGIRGERSVIYKLFVNLIFIEWIEYIPFLCEINEITESDLTSLKLGVIKYITKECIKLRFCGLGSNKITPSFIVHLLAKCITGLEVTKAKDYKIASLENYLTEKKNLDYGGFLTAVPEWTESEWTESIYNDSPLDQVGSKNGIDRAVIIYGFATVMKWCSRSNDCSEYLEIIKSKKLEGPELLGLFNDLIKDDNVELVGLFVEFQIKPLTLEKNLLACQTYKRLWEVESWTIDWALYKGMVLAIKYGSKECIKYFRKTGIPITKDLISKLKEHGYYNLEKFMRNL